MNRVLKDAKDIERLSSLLQGNIETLELDHDGLPEKCFEAYENSMRISNAVRTQNYNEAKEIMLVMVRDLEAMAKNLDATVLGTHEALLVATSLLLIARRTGILLLKLDGSIDKKP